MGKEVKVDEKVEEVKLWQLGQAPSEFVPVIVKGDMVMNPNEAGVRILNDLELIKRTLGVKE